MALPALDGTSPHGDPADDSTERVWVTLPKSVVKAIDDYHHEHRFKKRGDAIEQLITLGLRTAPFRSKNLT